MQSKLNRYLNFQDNTREAMEFYRTVFGGTLELHTFEEYHASQVPSEDHKIMHSMLEAENGITFMAADTPNRQEEVNAASAGQPLERCPSPAPLISMVGPPGIGVRVSVPRHASRTVCASWSKFPA